MPEHATMITGLPPDIVVTPPPNDSPRPERILHGLKSSTTSREEKRRLVLEAEMTDFDPSSAPELSLLLWSFIEENRDSKDPDDLVAVGAAIRKYVADLESDEIGAAAMLLDAGHSASVPVAVELEVAKMLVQRLTRLPPEHPDSEPELADLLMELARTYLNARLLPRERYGAVALNSVLALLLLRSRHTAELFEILAGLRVSWFRDLLGRRARRLQADIMQRFPPERSSLYAADLAALERLAQPSER
jgi:hypothetical protein